MIHPDTVLAAVGNDMGVGLVARRPIPKGTLIWVRDALDQILPAIMVAALPPLFADLTLRFAYRNHQGDYLLTWDDTRFMNHSCEHNCALTPFDFEIAVRDIGVGEQLTNDYAMLNLEPDERLDCLCGTPSCRGIIAAADQAVLQGRWHAEILAALNNVDLVTQALLPLLPEGRLRAALSHYCGHRSAMAGIVANS